MELEKAVMAYHQAGVAVVANVFTSQETQKMRAEALLGLTNASPDNPYRQGGRLQVSPIGGPALMFWPALISPFLNAIRCDSRMVNLVKRFLGDDVKQLNNQLYYRLPGDGDAFAYHQDAMFRKSMAVNYNPDDYLQTIIAIDPMTEHNSPITFVVGSHRMGDLSLCDKPGLRTQGPIPDRLKGFHTITPLLKPGDVLVWHVMVAHGSCQNTSQASRMTYMNGFCRARACRDWPQYIKGDVVTQVDKKAIPYG